MILIAIVLAKSRQKASPSLYRTGVLGSGILTQRLCGEVFVAKRDPTAVLAEDLSGPGYELLPFFHPIVDRDKRVIASALGTAEGERVDLSAPPASVERTALEQAIAAAFAEPSAMSLHLTPRRPSLDQTIQEVWTEIAQDGVISHEALRTRLAQKLIRSPAMAATMYRRRSLCSERSATIH